MRQFMEDIDNEFYVKNSIYDINTNLSDDLIVLELDRVMVNNGRYHRTLVDENISLPSMIPYRIFKEFRPDKYNPRTGYNPDDSDIIGYTSYLRIVKIHDVDCIVINIGDLAKLRIKNQLSSNEEFDFTIMCNTRLVKGDILSGGVDTKYISSLICIFFNRRLKK